MRQSGSFSLVILVAASLGLLLATQIVSSSSIQSHKSGGSSARTMVAKVNHLIRRTKAAKAHASKHEAGKLKSVDLQTCMAAYDEAINKLSQSVKFYEAHDINNFTIFVSDDDINQWHIYEHQYVDNPNNPFGSLNWDLSNGAGDILSMCSN